jgi:nitrite reductase/ring-hydroxylating ferredoxin subunit
MPSFFDPTLIEQRGAAFVREDKVDEALQRLIPNAHITKGSYSTAGGAEQRDLVWNHMDQNHRPLIHRTYGEAMRVAISERSAFSLTRLGSWPAVIPVFDGHHKENGFYQVLCLFGLIVVVNVIECNVTGQGTRMDIRWAIASHRLLRFLHPMLDRRLHRLNVVQNAEDAEIRERRAALRAMGYRFGTDLPDFVNANALSNNVVFPPLAGAQSVAIAQFPDGQPTRIDVGDRAYVVRRAGDAVEIWPGICLHEGAALAPGDLHGNTIKCPWHGLEYGGRQLKPGSGPLSLCGARLELAEGQLRVSPLAGASS